MGYYEDDNGFGSRKKPKDNKRGYFFSGFIGAVIGGLVVSLTSPYLMDNQTNENQSDAIIEKTDKENNSNSIVQNVSVKVETDVTKAVNKAGGSVVGITNIQGGNVWTQAQEAGTGSGVIYKKQDNSAYIVTNHHVVEGANRLEVTLANGEKIEAKLLGSDLWTDLAVLQVDGNKIQTVAEFGDSDALKLGEPVIAIGNPLGLEFAGSITQGIISGLERTVPLDFDGDGIPDWNAEVLQTDAAINPGNSGGALVNIAGQVVGINSMKIAQEQVEGIGFSIPINTAIPIIEDLEKNGVVKRPYMGVSLEDINEVPIYHQQQTLHLPDNIKSGLLIAEIAPGGPADQGGLKQLDVIVKLDGQEVNNIIDLRKHLYTKKEIGDQLKVGFYRNGKYQEKTITLTGEGR